MTFCSPDPTSMLDLVEALDAVDRVVAAARGLVSDRSADRAATRMAELRKRRGFQGETLLFAIAGGTGSGKSSLLNAIAGDRVASVSPLRPHTNIPLAWVPESRGPALDSLLTGLGIVDVVQQVERSGLALIDLPDMDSVAKWHRRVVTDLIPAVDGIIWVFDPVKYRDPTLYDAFLIPLAEYGEHFTFVLNKVDAIPADGRDLIAADLRVALSAAGYPDPLLFLTSADPVIGPALGIAALDSFLSRRIAANRSVVEKWLIDLRRELRRVADDAGLWTGASLDYQTRWERDRDAAISAVTEGEGTAARSDAACRLEDLIAMIVVEVGPRVGEPIAARFPPGSVDSVLSAAVESAHVAAAATRRKRKSAAAGIASAVDVVDRQIGWPLQVLLDDRARLGALLAEAGVTIAQAWASLDEG